MVPDSSRIIYGGNSGSSDDWELLSDFFDNGEAEDFTVFDTGGEILLMVPQTSKFSC